MATQPINLDIRTKGAKKSKDEIGGLGRSIKSLGTAAIGAGAAYFGTRGLINAIVSSTEAFGIQEQAEKSLEVALGKTSQALLNQASALQKVTTFGDESIIGVQASIAAFIDSEEQIKKATEATLDIAVAMGMDLKSAGDLVAKTLGSSTNAMSRYGIEVKGAVGSTERLESLTGSVAELFGGQATAQAQTYAGSVQQLKNSLGDMAEDVGAIVIPVFQALEPHLRTAIDFWSGYLDVGNRSKEGQKLLSNEVSQLNLEIEKQTSLIDYISSESYNTFELRKKRAADQSRTLGDQIRHEYHELERNRDILEELNQKKENQLKIEDALTKSHENSLEIRKAGMDFEVNYVEVIEPTLKTINKHKKEQIANDIKSALIQGQSAKDAMKSVIKAESAEALAGLISSIFKTVAFPLNIAVAAGASTIVGGLIDKGLSAFATGGDFVTSGPQMIMVGDNPGGRERVQVTPLSSQNINGPQGGITLNISAPLVDETVVDSIIPAIEKAQRMNLA